MRRRRRIQEPDTRPRWDDPDLGVYLRTDGVAAPAHIVEKVAQWAVERSKDPNWKQDPTYNLRRRRNKDAT